MGLTFKRFGFGVLALAAMLLPMRKPAQESGAVESSNRTQRLDSLGRQLRSAQLSWSAFDLRDSAKALIAITRQGSEVPAVAFRGFAAGTAIPKADSILTNMWTNIGATHADAHTWIMVYNNTPYRRSSYSGALISRDGAATNCVAIMPASVDSRTGRVYLWDNLSESLAPCALLAAFGAPGHAVGAWLGATGYAPAGSNEWLTTIKPADTRFSRGPWVEWNDRTPGRAWPEEMYGWWQTSGFISYALMLRPPYYYGASGIRCINGDERSCVTGVLHSEIALPAAESLPAELTLSAWSTSPPATTVGTVRPPSPRIVSAMITEFGREKFQKFWSSDQPFEVAFQSAFGETLGAWTARWAAREWAGSYEAKHGNPEILLGVTLKPSWIPLLFGWSILAIAIAAGVAKRRTA